MYRIGRTGLLNSYRGHMHLHGMLEVIWPGRVRDYYGPGANRRDVIASINNYNHNWQTSFVFADDARPILPAGTAIVMRTHFDNTENNPLSIDPDQWVERGRDVPLPCECYLSRGTGV